MQDLFLQYANHIGIIGVLITLIAYLLLSVGRLASESFTYSLLNFVGSWLILFSLMFYWNLSSVVIEIAWISISVIGMYRYFRLRKQKI
jgi:hypothetical protein